MKTNRNFGKLEHETLIYAPAILRVVTHHHDEWDEPVIDPETGEPVIDPATGEPVTEHKTRDWDTWETKLWPTAEDYARMGWLKVIDERPSDPAPEGCHYEPRGWEERDGAIRRVYEAVANPPPPPRRWTRLSIKTALATAGMLDAAKAFLSASEIATGYTAWEALTDCDYIEEGYPTAAAWNALLDGAAQALGKTRAEVDAFLDAIPREG